MYYTVYPRLCNIRSVKENDSKSERRFCFEIQMPNRSLLLQAEDAETRDSWVATMNKAIGFYLNEGQRKTSLPKDRLFTFAQKRVRFPYKKLFTRMIRVRQLQILK